MSDSKSKYEILKELLIGDELEQQEEVNKQLTYLEQEIKVKEKLEQNVEPILAERFMRLKREFPKEFGPVLAKTIRQQFKDNPEDMMLALAPVVNELLDRYFSDRWAMLRAFTGFSKNPPSKNPTDLYREDVFTDSEELSDETKLNDVFVIDNSNLSKLGHYSKFQASQDSSIQEYLFETIRDMVDQALNTHKKGLDWSEYDNYKIYLITFKRISVGCTVSGYASDRYKIKLEDQVMEFAKDLLPELDPDNRELNEKMANRFLQNHFAGL